MSRRSQRLSQNAASLIRPAMVVHVCKDCGRYAIPCYDLQGQKAGDYCDQHRKSRGFCVKCGNELDKAEKVGSPTGKCGACLRPRYHIWADEPGEDDL